ncbi:MAG: hypothetical protein A2V76_01225 [Candidatus Aminicenantes bacterium RBG_16_63_14]|nr:MAG: hypothetical protein A2V76_01225 [Candidatus Aminicenantes bacterium RBG_16_63_14]OGD29164.1 MAG: hypothetical protein A2V57_04175 [Candidatus Aminicenantes bacterium RBG_19FT_COMBO_65_30]
MPRLDRSAAALIAAALVLSLTPASLVSQDLEAKAELPVLVTSCGQSIGPTTIKVVLQRLKLAFDIDPLATPETLQAKAKAGTPYRSLIITMGASLKGMGAAGIEIEDELARAADLMAEARKLGVKIIGAHIEGMKRRSQGAAAGDTTDEQTIDAVAPNSAILLVLKEGNADGRFTVISQARKIPLVEFEKTMDLIPALEKLFAK